MTGTGKALAANPIETSLGEKERRLFEILRQMERAIIAFSGGVDSSYLAYMAHAALGRTALAITALSPSVPERQKQEALDFARRFGLNHRVIETGEVDKEEYRKNPPNRCYFCKTELYEKLQALALQLGIPWIADGTNLDDLGDYRPGRQAAAEHNVRHPLAEAGMTKQDIRQLSRRAGLPTWDQPASPCLSSRFAYGIEITPERLRVVERGEELLRALGFREFRVRYHGELVRLEFAGNELARALDPEMARTLAKEFKRLGFKYITLDLEGYRSGAMNEVL